MKRIEGVFGRVQWSGADMGGDVVMMLMMMMRAGYLIYVLITFIMTLDVLFALFSLLGS